MPSSMKILKRLVKDGRDMKKNSPANMTLKNPYRSNDTNEAINKQHGSFSHLHISKIVLSTLNVEIS